MPELKEGDQVFHDGLCRWFTLDHTEDGEAFCSDDSGGEHTFCLGELSPCVED